MKTLSSALNAAYGYAVQKPAWLVQIDLSTPIYLASHTAVASWNGHAWALTDVDVSGLKVGALTITGNLIFGNADDTYASIALNESFTDKLVRIWGYDANIATPAAGDPQLVCDGVGAGADIRPDRVRVGLRDACEYRIGPRAVVTPAWGFNTLIAAGTTLTINGASFIIQRGR